MAILVPKPVSAALQDEIDRSAQIHDFILRNIPDAFTGDSDEKILVSSFFSLVLEHQLAILHLLRTGIFDGSALALVRPLIDAAYRAHWVYSCASPENIASIRAGKKCDPGLINVAEAVEKAVATGGFFLAISPYIEALHGYTHGGLEQLTRRFNAEGDIQPNYTDEEKIFAIRTTTAHLTALAIAWCQLSSGDGTADDPIAKAISDFFPEKYGSLAQAVQAQDAMRSE